MEIDAIKFVLFLVFLKVFFLEPIICKTNLSLEVHPQGLTCTVYIKLVSSKDIDVYEEIIHANKLTSIYSIASHGNFSIPDPTIHFLEQCTITIAILGNLTYDSIRINGLVVVPQPHHFVRPFPHCIAIYVITDSCNNVLIRAYKVIDAKLFYHYLSCEYAVKTLFPNALITTLDPTTTQSVILPRYSESNFSIFDPEQSIKTFQSFKTLKPLVYVPELLTRSNRFIAENYCKRLKWFSTKTVLRLGHCTENYVMVSELELYFNFTATPDNALAGFSSGEIIFNAAHKTSLKRPLFFLTTRIYITFDLYSKFIYCLLKDETLLITFRALFSPFQMYTWIALTLILWYVFCLYARSNPWFVIKSIWEQDVDISDTKTIAFSFCIFILTSIYKTKLTSDLISVRNPSPVQNITELINSNYSYLYDRSISENAAYYLQQAKLNLTNSSLVFANVTSILIHYDTASLLRGKYFGSANLISTGTSQSLKTVEEILHNVSCFTVEPYLHRQWISYVFAHPQYAEMIRFTQRLKEAGVISYYHSIENGIAETNAFPWLREKLSEVALESKRAMFITLHHSKSIFILHFFFLFMCVLIFGATLYDSRSLLA